MHASRIVGVTCLGVLLLPLLFAQGHGQEKDKRKTVQQDKAKEKPMWQEFIEQSKREDVSGRKNGVLLQSQVSVKKKGMGGVVLIHWLLDYNGRRPPLTIIKPSLDIETLGQCAVEFFPVDKDGNAHGVNIQPDPKGVDLTWLGFTLGNPARERFITVKKGEEAQDTLEVPLAKVEAIVREKHADKFRKFPPDLMFVRLRFRPSSRGEPHELDAWTGELLTPLVRVPLEKLLKD